jgi:hypothetical protein
MQSVQVLTHTALLPAKSLARTKPPCNRDAFFPFRSPLPPKSVFDPLEWLATSFTPFRDQFGTQYLPKMMLGVAVVTTLTAAGDPPVVNTSGGRVSGSCSGDVCLWQNIPFAKSPVGDLR